MASTANNDNGGLVKSLSPRPTKHALPEPVDGEDCNYPDEGSGFGAFLTMFRGGLIAPTGTTYDSIRLLLTAESVDERDQLTRQWRDHKLQELNFIGIVGALLAGCMTSTGSWPTVLPNGEEAPWPVRTCWYAGIVFSLFAVLTAAQQSIRLHRLSGHKDAMKTIRHYMGCRKRDEEGVLRIKPRRFQVYGWQASIMFLTLSVAALLVGMCILIWSSTQFGPYKTVEEGWWDNNAKLAVTWSIITLVTVIAFLAAQISLAMRKDDA
ncbi:hypothetical protein BAUCODRAFT_144184 [Baudoinia panamericana UAMH 10762]|uniref:Uncharacterized protein n=1 Tax=Baudoinia panamericana (strain UAMH 10762) TaxID=717646 RepID=M2NMV5_BAUPA|nr:uncharacterized protein BAUCODRAFT_144184 [Baudoinia panamericana UAMH 10762]EMD00526.1 hypothetical protein BAUCODRAFT_144184 [Baudoinia panamericana UAMH 10762]